MTHRTLFAALLMLSAAATSAFAADGSFEKNLSFNGTPTVYVSTGSGYIHINPGTDNQFHVVGHVHSHTGWLAAQDTDEAVKHILANPPVNQSGTIITIGPVNNSGLSNNISIDYDITTPRSTLLTSHTGSGGIEIAGISGRVAAESGSGSLRLSLANSNEVYGQTGSGSIHIEGVTGTLHARTGSGSIEAVGNVGSDWNLSTGSGTIRINLPNSARFSLDVSTGSGAVRVDQPIMMHGSLNHHHVVGTVNGGGPLIHVSTGSGSITID